MRSQKWLQDFATPHTSTRGIWNCNPFTDHGCGFSLLRFRPGAIHHYLGTRGKQRLLALTAGQPRALKRTAPDCTRAPRALHSNQLHIWHNFPLGLQAAVTLPKADLQAMHLLSTRLEASALHYGFVTASRRAEIWSIRIHEATITVVFSKRRKTSSF